MSLLARPGRVDPRNFVSSEQQQIIVPGRTGCTGPPGLLTLIALPSGGINVAFTFAGRH